jgi:hypothetical protein
MAIFQDFGHRYLLLYVDDIAALLLQAPGFIQELSDTKASP